MTLDRRSFVMSLFGGLAAASLAGVAASQAATPARDAAPATPAGEELDSVAKAGLDQAEAEFAQLYRRPLTPHHRRPPPPPHHRRRPPPVYRQPRRVIRNGRVYYVR